MIRLSDRAFAVERDAKARHKGYRIIERCIDCGNCVKHCPVQTIVDRKE